jgi:hypothetical protein
MHPNFEFWENVKKVHLKFEIIQYFSLLLTGLKHKFKLIDNVISE